MLNPLVDVSRYPCTNHDNDRSDATEGLYSRRTVAPPQTSDMAEGHTHNTVMREPSNAMAIMVIMKMAMIMIITCTTVMMMMMMMMMLLVISIFRRDKTKVKCGR